jgi:cytochrome P450
MMMLLKAGGPKTAGHIGTGIGVHNCVGQVIARMEGEA